MARSSNPMQGKGESAKKRLSAFDQWKENRQRVGVNWTQVDAVTLKACLATCVSADVAIMVTGAAGGTGVCITIWVDRERYKEYANNSEEVNQLLDAITDAYSSTSEDIRATVRGIEVVQGRPSDS